MRYGASHLVHATRGESSPADRNRVTGIFRRTDSGYGFVRPAGSVPGADRRHDIYIAAKDAGDASSGDTVLVRLRAKRASHRPNPEGEIVDVIERQTNQFVGTYFESAGAAFVQVDGKPFNRPILVGDPGRRTPSPTTKSCSR